MRDWVCVGFAGLLAVSLLPAQVPVPNTRNFSMFGSSLDSVTVVRGGKALQTPPAPALSSTPPSTLPLALPTNGPAQANSIVVQPVVPGKSLSNNGSGNGSSAGGGNTPTAERKVSGVWCLDEVLSHCVGCTTLCVCFCCVAANRPRHLPPGDQAVAAQQQIWSIP